IAEPWDIGMGGYQVGNFPPGWNEWNDKYRDTLRAYWKGDGGLLPDLARRITGSADLYEASGRKPNASINFITAHDGFTLEDLVSYNDKHNEANGEENRDGHSDNRSWNCGAEGPTDNQEILNLRRRQRLNMLASLLLSQGVPMILGGDELGHSQQGNNNAYCQDNEISWLDWDLDERRRALLSFAERLVALRKAEPALRRRRFFSGGYVRDSELKDIVWWTPEGAEMTAADWSRPDAHALGMLLGGDAIPSLDRFGQRIAGSTLLVLMNAGTRPVEFVLPAPENGEAWEVLVDTRSAEAPKRSLPVREGERYAMLDRSMAVMRLREAAWSRAPSTPSSRG